MLSEWWHNHWGDGQISGRQWRGSLNDGSGRMRSLGVRSSDKLFRGIYGVRHVSFVDWLVSRIEASLRLPCTPLISLLFAETTLLERFRHHCQRFVRSTPASLNLIRSLFSSVSDSLRSIYFFFHLSFSPFLVKIYVFCTRHPFFNPVSLRFCHYV